MHATCHSEMARALCNWQHANHLNYSIQPPPDLSVFWNKKYKKKDHQCRSAAADRAPHGAIWERIRSRHLDGVTPWFLVGRSPVAAPHLLRRSNLPFA